MVWKTIVWEQFGAAIDMLGYAIFKRSSSQNWV